MHFEKVRVSPAMAVEWLERCNTHNRPIRQSKVGAFADDIKNDRWKLTHQPIAFTGKTPGAGTLVDGQHRLWAVIEADKAALFTVATDADVDSQMVIDTGVCRLPADVLSLFSGNGKVTNAHASALRYLVFGLATPQKLANAEYLRLWGLHGKAIQAAFAMFLPKRPNTLSGPVLAVVARATYTVKDRDKLEEFCRVLTDGVAGTATQRPCIILRDFLLGLRGNGSASANAQRYRKTERALLAFVRGEKVQKLFALDQELFPLPEEIAKSDPRSIVPVLQKSQVRSKMKHTRLRHTPSGSVTRDLA